MRTSPSRIASFAFLLCCAGGAAAAADDIVAFNTSVKVQVDATGKPVLIEAPAGLPESVAAAVEKRVASWTYLPAQRDGKPVAAVTYVNVGACALPAQGGYRLGVDFKGNGPRVHSDTGRLPPPSYPLAMAKAGAGGTFRVSYIIQADGSARLQGIESLDGDVPRRHEKLFKQALEDWIAQLHYDPELVDGQAVETRISFPVAFNSDDRATLHGNAWRERYAAELRERAIQSDECKLASGTVSGPMPLAIDSPVKVIPTPSG